MTVKLKGDQDNYSKDEAASFMHSKLGASIKNTKMSQGQNVKSSNYFEHYLNRYSDQAQQFPAGSF